MGERELGSTGGVGREAKAEESQRKLSERGERGRSRGRGEELRRRQDTGHSQVQGAV